MYSLLCLLQRARWAVSSSLLLNGSNRGVLVTSFMAQQILLLGKSLSNFFFLTQVHLAPFINYHFGFWMQLLSHCGDYAS